MVGLRTGVWERYGGYGLEGGCGAEDPESSGTITEPVRWMMQASQWTSALFRSKYAIEYRR